MVGLTKRIRAIHVAWIAALLFFLAGQAFIARTGVEADESLPFSPLLDPKGAIYLRFFGHPWPVLLMPYLGTLKTLIYKPLIALFGTGLWTLREPMVLAGALTLPVFFLILRRVSGDRSALIGCGLLATDSMYLLTVCYDWGPVALQHLLLLSGTLFALQFFENRRLLPLAAAGFLFGLALWDKALSIWLLSSMGVAALVLCPRKMFSAATRRTVPIALLAFILGGLPILRYNLRTHWSTFRGGFTRDVHFLDKLPHLYYTLDGRGMFGWMMPMPGDSVPNPHAPGDILTAASDKISSAADHPTRDWMLYALAASLLLIPLARGRDLRTLLFCLLVFLGGWLQMALTLNAGGSVHHIVLLWPLPQAMVAVSLAAAFRYLGKAAKPALAVVSAGLMISNVLVLNEYYAVLYRDGAVQAWSNAMLPLADYLKTAPAAHVLCVDWGILEPLRYLDAGKLPLEGGIDPINKPALDLADEQQLAHTLDRNDQLVVMHTKAAEQFAGIRDKLLHFAEQHGYRRQVLTTISDGFGRDIFEVCRFSKT